MQGQYPSLNNVMGRTESSQKKTRLKQEMRMQLQTVLQWPFMTNRMNPGFQNQSDGKPNSSNREEVESPDQQNSVNLEFPQDPVIEEDHSEKE